MAVRGSTTTARAHEMRRVLRRWERSGLTLAEFGRREHLVPATLAWWRHVWRRAEASDGARPRRRAMRRGAGKRPEPSAHFVELKLRAAEAMPPGSSAIEIVLRRGLIIRVAPGFDASALRAVMDALEARC